MNCNEMISVCCHNRRLALVGQFFEVAGFRYSAMIFDFASPVNLPELPLFSEILFWTGQGTCGEDRKA